MEERLQAMPEKRPMPWRPGVEPGAEIETGGDSRRKQIRFGCLLATRGDVAPVPCNSCANGRGKFKVCVALEGYFKGACASCQLSGRPNRCSIKQGDDAVLSPNPEIPGGGEISTHEALHPSPATLQSSGPASRSGPPSKRRRTNEVPEWESTRPQWEQELGDSHARQQLNDIVQVQRPWATVNTPAPSAPPPTLRNNVNESLPQNSVGWAAVNQPLPTGASRVVDNGLNSNGNVPRRDLEQDRREEPEEGPSALIDRLPKTKQRQVYGLVSGLQGGIEHLQRELDALKKALGIDEE